MVHDQDLLDRLSVLQGKRFAGEVFRATRINADPVAASLSGGRWSPSTNANMEIHILYTTLDRDGAIAEVASFLSELTPVPGPRQIKVSRLAVSTRHTIRLARANLPELGVDLDHYGERDYGQTQRIGAALAFLGFDGLIAPSARWACESLMLFTKNHAPSETLEVMGEEHVEWQAWSRRRGMLP